ncbi:hypothetical protein RHGRI_015797 [Rhododendron griersonianum]|uniref:Uncharacterized protein n=1 Tax=Rhododendron griersonianum TaxID=479676 RepID=A0AAV6JNJ1_9ERIC|nr:hypothetical protein RHGRI_015797 [Rhododendron griersonianum]
MKEYAPHTLHDSDKKAVKPQLKEEAMHGKFPIDSDGDGNEGSRNQPKNERFQPIGLGKGRAEEGANRLDQGLAARRGGETRRGKSGKQGKRAWPDPRGLSCRRTPVNGGTKCKPQELQEEQTEERQWTGLWISDRWNKQWSELKRGLFLERKEWIYPRWGWGWRGRRRQPPPPTEKVA